MSILTYYIHSISSRPSLLFPTHISWLQSPSNVWGQASTICWPHPWQRGVIWTIARGLHNRWGKCHGIYPWQNLSAKAHSEALPALMDEPALYREIYRHVLKKRGNLFSQVIPTCEVKCAYVRLPSSPSHHSNRIKWALIIMAEKAGWLGTESRRWRSRLNTDGNWLWELVWVSVLYIWHINKL